jgi:hypothetical protein
MAVDQHELSAGAPAGSREPALVHAHAVDERRSPRWESTRWIARRPARPRLVAKMIEPVPRRVAQFAVVDVGTAIGAAALQGVADGIPSCWHTQGFVSTTYCPLPSL